MLEAMHDKYGGNKSQEVGNETGIKVNPMIAIQTTQHTHRYNNHMDKSKTTPVTS